MKIELGLALRSSYSKRKGIHFQPLSQITMIKETMVSRDAGI